MKQYVKIHTESNYRKLNGSILPVKEVVGNRVSCIIYDEFDREITADFTLSEIVVITDDYFDKLYSKTLDHYSHATAPKRSFTIGDRVSIGSLHSPVIVSSLDYGRFYLVESRIDFTKYDHIRSVGFSIHPWYSVFPDSCSTTHFANKHTWDIRMSNQVISSLLHRFYTFGIDMSPEYQRDYVWELSDQVALVDSIFNNIEIGRFLIHCSGDYDNLDEIVDGKQRLSAIVDFYEGMFQYRGKFFHELSHHDRFHFTNYPIAVGEVTDLSLREKYELFLKINTTGRVMDNEHLDKIKKQLEEM